MTEVYYRYVDTVIYAEWDGYGPMEATGMKVSVVSYRVNRRTRKGAWIETGYKKEKFILDGARKRWAYPTKEEALQSFLIRKQWQSSHGERTTRNAKWSIATAKKMIEEQVK